MQGTERMPALLLDSLTLINERVRDRERSGKNKNEKRGYSRPDVGSWTLVGERDSGRALGCTADQEEGSCSISLPIKPCVFMCASGDPGCLA